jgi:hypothetical protein
MKSAAEYIDSVETPPQPPSLTHQRSGIPKPISFNKYGGAIN